VADNLAAPSSPVEHAFMPPFACGHSDDELAAVANVSHVRQAGNLNLKSALRRLRGTHIRMRAGATQDS